LQLRAFFILSFFTIYNLFIIFFPKPIDKSESLVYIINIHSIYFITWGEITNIVIEFQSSVPAYEQIKEQIKAAIMSGEISAGEMLPSVRGLARELRISNITTIRAYSDLENEGLVKNVQGRGCFVNVLPQNIVREQYLSEIDRDIDNIVGKAQAAGLTLEELHSKLEGRFSTWNKKE
jgi:GntR family transcriptional regulator